MSTTPDTRTCTECEAEFDLPNDRPNHCGDRCWFADKGRSLVKQVKSESTTCPTCFSRVFEKGELPDRAPDNANPERFVRFDGDYSDENGAVRNDLDWSWACACGDCDPWGSDPDNQLTAQGHIIEARRENLFAALERLADRGGIHTAPERERFDDALRTFGPFDLTASAGYAVHGEN